MSVLTLATGLISASSSTMHSSLTVTIGGELPVLNTLQSHPLHWQLLGLTQEVVGILLGQDS